MANIAKRQQRDYPDPWRDFFDLDFLGNRSGNRSHSLPAVNICEDEKTYEVDVVAPGFKKDDFKVNMEDDILTISAEQKQEKESKDGENKQFSRREYSYSSFTRSFQLPENTKADGIVAKYEDGVLKITIPKTAQKPKTSKQITIQ